jgi:hypothetical protein
VKKLSMYAAVLAGAALSIAASCSKGDDSKGKTPAPLSTVPGHDSLAQDTAPKEGPRVVPPEAYLRSYMQLFGGLSPLEVQTAAKPSQLFDTWNDYLGLLGLPDYGTDIPRGTQTNALMLATFERIGVALCDRALEHDLKASPPTPLAERRIYAFEMPAAAPTQAEFAERFDVLHRTFLGYPAALATRDRTGAYFKLYNDIVAAPPTTNSKFKPEEAGWAAICYGLVRHPEFHLY